MFAIIFQVLLHVLYVLHGKCRYNYILKGNISKFV